MAKSNWAYDLLLDTFKKYYEKNPVSILTKAEEAIKELQEVQQKELKELRKCIKSGQLDSTRFKSEANQGLEESKANQTTTASTISTNISVKLEKLSLTPLQEDSEKENKNVLNEDMPAPTWVPPVKKKAIKTERVSTTRTTRTKSKNQSTMKESDVIFQSVPIPVVNLTEENGNESVARTTRSTIAKKDVEAAKDVFIPRKTRTKTRAATRNVAQTRSTGTETIRKGKSVEEVPETEAEIRTTKTIRKAKNTEDVDGDASKLEASNLEEVGASSTKIVDENTTVTVPEKETEEKLKNEEGESKSKRTRPISDEDAEEIQNTKTKKSKSNPPQPLANSPRQTFYEDARSTMGSAFVSFQRETVQANSKFALSKYNMSETKKNPEEQRHQLDNNDQCESFTDDESIKEERTPPSKEALSKHNSTTQVSSRYEKTALKKKMEAFENLQSGTDNSVKRGGNKLPQLINSGVKEKTKLLTPTSSSNIPISKMDNSVKTGGNKLPELINSGVKEKTKLLTSTFSSNIPISKSVSTSKINRFFPQQSKDRSETQSCPRDPREYARKQQELERATKKMEVPLAYQVEQLCKLNKERKTKLLEIQKSKQDKLRQRELEREENHKMYLQEQERKRTELKKRLLETLKLEKKPIYMTTKPPMLTADDYDSDDANYKNTTVTRPSWCTGSSRKLQLIMMSAGQKLKNTMFCAKPVVVNLIEIFERIDQRKLKRTSSAIWMEPPRYTMMPVDVLNKTKFSDDDDVFED